MAFFLYCAFHRDKGCKWCWLYELMLSHVKWPVPCPLPLPISSDTHKVWRRLYEWSDFCVQCEKQPFWKLEHEYLRPLFHKRADFNATQGSHLPRSEPVRWWSKLLLSQREQSVFQQTDNWERLQVEWLYNGFSRERKLQPFRGLVNPLHALLN